MSGAETICPEPDRRADRFASGVRVGQVLRGLFSWPNRGIRIPPRMRSAVTIVFREYHGDSGADRIPSGTGATDGNLLRRRIRREPGPNPDINPDPTRQLPKTMRYPSYHGRGGEKRMGEPGPGILLPEAGSGWPNPGERALLPMVAPPDAPIRPPPRLLGPSLSLNYDLENKIRSFEVSPPK